MYSVVAPVFTTVSEGHLPIMWLWWPPQIAYSPIRWYIFAYYGNQTFRQQLLITMNLRPEIVKGTVTSLGTPSTTKRSY